MKISNMQNIQKKESALWWRLQFLELTKISLNLLKKTNDKNFYEQAKFWGNESRQKETEYQEIL